MKRFLIVGMATAGALVALTVATHVFENHVRAGNFDVYSTAKFADSSVSSSLYYRGRKLTDRLGSQAVDPNDPDRTVFSSDDTYHGSKSVCGTFLYDGKTKRSMRLRDRPWAAGNPITWSPDSRYILLDETIVRELLTDQETDLSEYVAKRDGQRPELELLQWSPDSTRLAARLGSQTEAKNWDEDLVEITVAPVSFRYVATIRDSSLVWTEREIRWVGGELQLADPAPKDRTILMKPAEELTWVAAAPRVPAQRPIHEGFCSSVGAKE